MFKNNQTNQLNTQTNAYKNKSLIYKNKVDINVLLNRVRKDQKKEKLENTIFVGLISIAVIVSGIIISFR